MSRLFQAPPLRTLDHPRSNIRRRCLAHAVRCHRCNSPTSDGRAGICFPAV